MVMDVLVLLTFGIIFILRLSIPDLILRRIETKIDKYDPDPGMMEYSIYHVNYFKYILKLVLEFFLIAVALMVIFFTLNLLLKFFMVLAIAFLMMFVILTLRVTNKKIVIENSILKVYKGRKVERRFNLEEVALVGLRKLFLGNYLFCYYLEFEDGSNFNINPNYQNWHRIVKLAKNIISYNSGI